MNRKQIFFRRGSPSNWFQYARRIGRTKGAVNTQEDCTSSVHSVNREHLYDAAGESAELWLFLCSLARVSVEFWLGFPAHPDKRKKSKGHCAGPCDLRTHRDRRDVKEWAGDGKLLELHWAWYLFYETGLNPNLRCLN